MKGLFYKDTVKVKENLHGLLTHHWPSKSLKGQGKSLQEQKENYNYRRMLLKITQESIIVKPLPIKEERVDEISQVPIT
jgi:hypothetical protein